MKFKTLQIHNIASIADATINFDQAPLANEKIFLICGDTGTGKSAILDSICLALYRKTPRINNLADGNYFDENMLNSKNKSVSTNDIRQYLKKGTKNGFVKLVFEGNDNNTYTSEISIAKNSNGNLNDDMCSLLDHKTKDVLTKKTEIKSKIEQITGLTFEQFCRTTMLAQGEFKKFLTSSETEKAEILEKLTGTEVYSTIGKRIYEINKKITTELENITKECQQLNLPSDEEIKELNDKKDTLGKEVATLQKQKDELTKKQVWLADDSKFQTELQKAEEDCRKAQAKKEENTEIEKLLSNWNNTANERNAIEKLRKTALAEAKNKQSERLLLANFKYLENKEIKKARDLELKKAECLSLSEKLKEKKQHETMFDDHSRIVNELERYSKDTSESKAFSQKAETEKAKLPQLEHDLSNIQTTIDALKKQKEQNAYTITEQQKLLENSDFTDIDNRKDKINEELGTLNNLYAQIPILKQQKSFVEICRKDIEDSKKETNKIKEELQAILPKLGQAENDKKQAEQLYKKQELSVDDFAKKIRSGLSSGDVCPVCGQKITEIVHDSEFEAILAPIKEDLDKKNKLLESLKDEKNKQEANLVQINKNEPIRQKKYNDSVESYQKTQSLFNEFCSKASLDANDETLKDKIVEAIKKSNDELSRIKVMISQRDNINVCLVKLRKEKDEIDKRERIALNNLNEQIAKIEKTKSEIKNFISLADQKSKSANEAIDSVKDKITYTNWQSDIKATIAKLNAEAQQYKTDKDKLNECNISIDNTKKEIENARKLYKKIVETESFKDWPKSDNFSPITQSAYTWESLMADSISLNENIKTTTNDRITSQHTIDCYLQTHSDVTYSYLEKLVEIDDAKRREIEDKIEQAKKELEAAKGARQQAENTLNDHLASKPTFAEDENYQTLSQSIMGLTNNIDNYNQEIGAINEKQEQNNEKTKQNAELEKRKEEKSKELDNWKPIKETFGDAEGRNFRKIAQAYVLKHLLVYANEQLRCFSDRYEMLCQDSLTILVRDLHSGGYLRPISMMSGGESFVLSLALALGLSSLSSDKVSADILFIDEGFGTLSSDILDVVMNTLGNLSVRKRVGVISHVETLRERIPVKLVVERINGSTSAVKVEG